MLTVFFEVHISLCHCLEDVIMLRILPWPPTGSLVLHHVRQHPAHIFPSTLPSSISAIMPSYLNSGPWQMLSLQSIVPNPYILVLPTLKKFLLAPKLPLDVVMEPYVWFCPPPTPLNSNVLCSCMSFLTGPCVYGRPRVAQSRPPFSERHIAWAAGSMVGKQPSAVTLLRNCFLLPKVSPTPTEVHI